MAEKQIIKYAFFLLVLANVCLSQGQQRINDTQIKDSNGNMYTIGYSFINKQLDCWIQKLDPNGVLLYQTILDSSPVDCKSLYLALDSKDIPYGAFSVTGGYYDSTYISQKSIVAGAFKDSIFNNYGIGGGPVASVLVRFDPSTGFIERGTFLKSIISPTSGKTNTYKVVNIGFCQDQILVYSQSMWKPFDVSTAKNQFVPYPDAGLVKNDGENFFRHYILISNDMKTVLKSSVKNPLSCQQVSLQELKFLSSKDNIAEEVPSSESLVGEAQIAL